MDPLGAKSVDAMRPADCMSVPEFWAAYRCQFMPPEPPQAHEAQQEGQDGDGSNMDPASRACHLAMKAFASVSSKERWLREKLRYDESLRDRAAKRGLRMLIVWRGVSRLNGSEPT